MHFQKEVFLQRLDQLLLAEGVTVKTADGKRLYQAVTKSVMAELYEDWLKQRKLDKRRCGYFCR